jgi:hypothetical protein
VARMDGGECVWGGDLNLDGAGWVRAARDMRVRVEAEAGAGMDLGAGEGDDAVGVLKALEVELVVGEQMLCMHRSLPCSSGLLVPRLSQNAIASPVGHSPLNRAEGEVRETEVSLHDDLRASSVKSRHQASFHRIQSLP